MQKIRMTIQIGFQEGRTMSDRVVQQAQNVVTFFGNGHGDLLERNTYKIHGICNVINIHVLVTWMRYRFGLLFPI